MRLSNIKATNKIFNKFKFATWTFGASNMSDTIRVKAGSTFIKYLKSMKIIVGGNQARWFVSDLRRIAQLLKSIQKKQGKRGLVQFLKVNSVLLQQSAAGHKLENPTLLGLRVSRTKGAGLPRLIPCRIRIMIVNKNLGYTLWIRYYLTLFAIYRVISYKGKLDLSSITDPGVFINFNYFDSFIPTFLDLFLGKFSLNRLIPRKICEIKTKMFSILKSSPQRSLIAADPLPLLTKAYAAEMKRDKALKRPGKRYYWSTHPVLMLNSIWAVQNSILYPTFRELTKYFGFGRLEFLLDSTPINPGVSLPLGKLGLKEEAAGKVRVFAMVDPITQWLLAPLHKLLFSILRKSPMDGTFNQLKPIYRLLRLQKRLGLPLYSLDLSQATDRLVASLQSRLLDFLFEDFPNFGQKWLYLLTGREYWIKSDNYRINRKIKYSVGQPMGALSSWAMLAFLHHFLVQVAAWRSGHPRNKLFTLYAVLGDDLVIGSTKVKDAYLEILSEIGAKCGLAKSLLSPTGRGLEFAKRTFIDGVDVSPVSWQELGVSMVDLTSWAAFASKHNLSLVRQFRFLGHGPVARRKSFRKLKHACQLVWLVNIAKLDFNTMHLSLRSRFPRCFDPLLPIFKEEVLDKLRRDILLQARKVGDLPDPSALFRGWGSKGGMPYVLSNVYNSWAFRDKINFVAKSWEIINPLRNMSKITTFDQAMGIYVNILKNKTLSSSGAFLLEPMVTNVGSSKKFPLQIKLYRRWSKMSFNLVRLIRKGSDANKPEGKGNGT